VESLKRGFKEQLREFEKEERLYEERYREAIARQYRIVNPEASEEEVREAVNTDWGDEGIFQTAVSTISISCSVCRKRGWVNIC